MMKRNYNENLSRKEIGQIQAKTGFALKGNYSPATLFENGFGKIIYYCEMAG